MEFEQELDVYRRELPNLIEHEGKFIVVFGESLIGIFSTYQDALTVGYQKCGLKPFLVKKIESVEQVQFFTRDIEPCRT